MYKSSHLLLLITMIYQIGASLVYYKSHPCQFTRQCDSEGGVGIVTRIHNYGSFDIKCVLGGPKIRVSCDHIPSLSLLVLVAWCRNDDDVDHLSLITPSYQPVIRQQNSPTSCDYQYYPLCKNA